MIFETYGPVKIPRQPNGLIANKPDGFWESVEEMCQGLSSACGCYVFAVTSSGGPTPRPWYIGQANKRFFKDECFGHQKLTHYNNVVADYGHATPVMFLIARKTRSGKFSKPSKSGHPDIDKLEEIFIGMGLARNKRLCNIQGTRLLHGMVLPGVINSPPGRPGKSALVLRKMFRL